MTLCLFVEKGKFYLDTYLRTYVRNFLGGKCENYLRRLKSL